MTTLALHAARVFDGRTNGNGTLEDQMATATDDDLIDRVRANAQRALRRA